MRLWKKRTPTKGSFQDMLLLLPQVPRGGVTLTRQGVVLKDLQSLVDYRKNPSLPLSRITKVLPGWQSWMYVLDCFIMYHNAMLSCYRLARRSAPTVFTLAHQSIISHQPAAPRRPRRGRETGERSNQPTHTHTQTHTRTHKQCARARVCVCVCVCVCVYTYIHKRYIHAP